MKLIWYCMFSSISVPPHLPVAAPNQLFNSPNTVPLAAPIQFLCSPITVPFAAPFQAPKQRRFSPPSRAFVYLTSSTISVLD